MLFTTSFDDGSILRTLQRTTWPENSWVSYPEKDGRVVFGDEFTPENVVKSFADTVNHDFLSIFLNLLIKKRRNWKKKNYSSRKKGCWVREKQSRIRRSTRTRGGNIWMSFRSSWSG